MSPSSSWKSTKVKAKGGENTYDEMGFTVTKIDTLTVTDGAHPDYEIEDDTGEEPSPTLYVPQSDLPPPATADAYVDIGLTWIPDDPIVARWFRWKTDPAGGWRTSEDNFVGQPVPGIWDESVERAYEVTAWFDGNHDRKLDDPTHDQQLRKVKVIVAKVEITKPEGDPDDQPVPASSWEVSPCYHFDFQGVTSGTAGTYALDVEGDILPTTLGYSWTLDSAAGTLTDVTTATPTHAEPASAGEGMLTLEAMDGATSTGCVDDQKLIVYQDHLARDYENFGTGTYCGAPGWTFTRFGRTITMTSVWNCHGSVLHAKDGSGTGDANEAALIAAAGSGTAYYPPFDTAKWTTIEASLSRGKIASFWGGSPTTTALQHSHTCRGTSSQMYGANNEPSVNFDLTPPATWKWDECDSEQYFDAINADSQRKWGFDFLREVRVH